MFGTLLGNYGCTVRAYRICFTDELSFQLSNIQGTDWIALLSVAVWLSLLIQPWMQYFTMRQKGFHASSITGRSGLLSVLIVFLAAACIFLNIRFGDEFDVQFGYDRLLLITAVVSLIYLPWSIVVILMNYRALKYVRYNIQANSKIWQWILSSFVFIALAALAFDGWYNWRYDFYEGRAVQWVDGKCGYINRLHNVEIPYVYDNCGDFSEGVAYVGINSEGDTRYGCIDKKGNIVIPCIYDWCSAPYI